MAVNKPASYPGSPGPQVKGFQETFTYQEHCKKYSIKTAQGEVN